MINIILSLAIAVLLLWKMQAAVILMISSFHSLTNMVIETSLQCQSAIGDTVFRQKMPFELRQST